MAISYSMLHELKRVERDGQVITGNTNKTMLALERRSFVAGEMHPKQMFRTVWKITDQGRAALQQ